MQNKLIIVFLFYALILLYSCGRTDQVELVEVTTEGVVIRSSSDKFPELKIFDGLLSNKNDGTWLLGSGSPQNDNNIVLQLEVEMGDLVDGEYAANSAFLGTYGNDEVFPKTIRCCKIEGTVFEVSILEVDRDNRRVIGEIRGKGELQYFTENEEPRFEIIDLKGLFNVAYRE